MKKSGVCFIRSPYRYRIFCAAHNFFLKKRGRNNHSFFSEPFENERSVSFLLINNIAHFMKMAGSEDNVPVSDAIPLEQNNDRSPEAAEIVSREKEAKKVNYRNEKTFKNNKAPPKRSTSINYAPKYVKNAAFVHKGRQTRGGPTNKPELRRKSVDYLYTNNIQSTRVRSTGFTRTA